MAHAHLFPDDPSIGAQTVYMRCICISCNVNRQLIFTCVDIQQCLSQELKKVRHMSHQAEKGETCLTTLRHVSRS